MDKNSKNVGYVLMLDMSGSMQSVLEQVRINAKAFVGYSFAGDEFAICQFSDEARWVYPDSTPSHLTTVSEGVSPEIQAACQKIGLLKVQNNTNIGAAISLGNDVICASTAAFKAFILLSDGENNRGPLPETILGTEPPIYIAGLGSGLKPQYFDNLVSKNSLSRYHNCPHFSDMMLLFNEIRGMIPGTRLLVNRKEAWSGRGTLRIPFTITSASGQVRIAVVWSAERYRYTQLQANRSNIHVHLEDNSGNILKTAPWLNSGGLCQFDLTDAQVGEWNICCEYDLDEACECTVGVFFKE